MVETRNSTINPIDFLAMYQKIQAMNPLVFERVCGIIEGIDIGFEVAMKQVKEGEKANEQSATN